MAEKIKGEFLRIREVEPDRYRIEYVREDGHPGWAVMGTDMMTALAEGAPQQIKQLESQLSVTTNPIDVEDLKSQIRYFQVKAVWPQMYVAHLKGEDVGRFFEKPAQIPPVQPSGIPLTRGKLLSKGEHGVVVSFNMEHLYLRTLYRAQLYSSDREPLTDIPIPHARLTDVFEYPRLVASPDFAFAQQECTAIVFVKSPNFEFAEATRVVFWFARNAMLANSDDDIIDVPPSAVPLLTADVTKKYRLAAGKPVPQELEDQIKSETENLLRDASARSYYIVDTLNLSEDDLTKLANESIRYVKNNSEPLVGSPKAKKEPKSGQSDRRMWTANKSEFCQLVRSEYDVHKNDYKSLRHATLKIFKQYKFQFRWSGKACYELVKKNALGKKRGRNGESPGNER